MAAVTGFKHGVYQRELPTSQVAPRQVDSALPFVVGTAPIHLSGTGLTDTSKQVNYPILAMNYEEAVTKLGYSDDWKKYSLCEFMYSHFQVYNVAPVIFVNVLDPEFHRTAVAQSGYPVNGRQAILGRDVILDSVAARTSTDGAPLTLGTDYTLAWNRDAEAVLNLLSGSLSEVFVSFDRIDPGKVTIADIVGGYNAASHRREGLELINDAFMKFGKVASLICAPGWSENPEVGGNDRENAERLRALPLVRADRHPERSWRRGGLYRSERVEEAQRLYGHTPVRAVADGGAWR